MGGRVGVHDGLTHGINSFILQIALYHIMSIRLRLSHSIFTLEAVQDEAKDA
jgi:hypothetical protein